MNPLGALAAGIGTLAMQWAILLLGFAFHSQRGFNVGVFSPNIGIISATSVASVSAVIITPKLGHWNSVFLFSIAIILFGLISGWKPVKDFREITGLIGRDY